MSPIDQRSEQFTREYVGKLSGSFKEDLVSIILYGSGASPYFEAGKSDINLLILLREIKPERLRQATQIGRNFRVTGAQPLFMLLTEFQQMADLFPIESLEIKESYQILVGDDVVNKIQISFSAVQTQLLRELMAKAIRCRAYFEENSRDPKALELFLRELISPYRTLMRTILRSVDDQYPPPLEFLEVIGQMEEKCKLPCESFRQVYLLKTGRLRLFKDEIRSLFEKILKETESLNQFANDLAMGLRR
ncbi:hypothetical protein HY229_04700 [Candidatus Acetothermia bacterium]|nr:hypothetical protein [Candidatus Acetothermia bacterium]MBI3643385.1 hypothetical protein [Candidatus Acetothermia bacterium]